MARYHLRLQNGSSIIAHADGQDFADAAAALKEAGVAAADVVRDELIAGETAATVVVEVTTGSGDAVGTVRVSATVENVRLGGGGPT